MKDHKPTPREIISMQLFTFGRERFIHVKQFINKCSQYGHSISDPEVRSILRSIEEEYNDPKKELKTCVTSTGSGYIVTSKEETMQEGIRWFENKYKPLLKRLAARKKRRNKIFDPNNQGDFFNA